MARFFEQKLHFSLFYQILIEKRFSKNWNHQKMSRATGFWPSAGRESLWTTGKKVGFSKAHCEVQKQPNLNFSF
jgi:hypothetical protein